MRVRGLACSLLSFMVAACVAPHAEEEVPAVLVADEQSHTTLTQTIAAALGTTSVTVADDVLTRSSRLIIEPTRPRGPDGHLLQGRELRAPEVFQLVKQSRDCVLVHERTRKEFVLQGVKCVPERAKGQ